MTGSMYSLTDTDKAPAEVVVKVVERHQDAADPWTAGKLLGAAGPMVECNRPGLPVLSAAGRAPGVAEGRSVQDCRPSEHRKGVLEATGRTHSADCWVPPIAW